MVQTCQVFKWSGFQMPYEFRTFSPVFKWYHRTIAASYVLIIECYSTSHSKTRLKCLVYEWLDHLNTGQEKVRYSYESSIRVSGIRMVTVLPIL